MEREQPPTPIDAEAIASALECEAVQQPGRDVFEYELRNEPLGVTLKLSVDRERNTVSLYLRGGTGFLGFVHIAGIQQVAIDQAKGEVTFIADGELSSQLSVQRGGVFLVTRTEQFV